jgi:hypothetical protein
MEALMEVRIPLIVLRTHWNLLGLVPGLLVAACVNRAPEGTFGAAVAEVGVLDLLRVRTPGLPRNYYQTH